MTLTYTGSVKEGQIKLPQRLKTEVVNNFDGKPIEVTFKRKRRTRSNQQNRYYWGVVIPYLVEGFIDLGNDLQSGNEEHRQWVHEAMKKLHLFNGQKIADGNGEMIELPPSTKTLTTTEMMDYIDLVVRWAADNLHISIPEPNEQMEIAF